MNGLLDNFFFFFLAVGLLLLPFSTDPKEGQFVIAYGLPFLFCAGFIGFFKFLLKNKIEKKTLHYFSVLFLYVFFILLTTFLSADILKSLVRSSVHVIGFCFLLYLFFRPVTDNENYDNLTRISLLLLYSGTIMALYNLYVSINAYIELGPKIIFYGRGTGSELSLPWASTNVIGACLLIPLIVGLYLYEMKINKKVLYLSLTIIILSIIITTSRNSFLSVLLLFSIIIFRKKKYNLLIVMILAICSFVGIIYFINTDLIDLYLETKIENTDNIKGLGNRTELMERVFNYFLDNPFSPIGYYGSLDKFEHSSHNYFITVLVEQGILALIINIFTILALLMFSKKNIILNTGVMIIFLNLSLEDANFTHPYIIYFWVFISIIFLNKKVNIKHQVS